MKWTQCFLFVLLLGSPAFAQGKSARELYIANCASCHGEKGDGEGTASLERRARSFVDGGFSYGNTPKAVKRTIVTGIPGTPMPAWGGAFSEEQIDQLADYVIELGPGLPPPPANTEMVVGSRPLVVRGMLPPISSEAESLSRGLLVGLPDGFTFEFRTDDLRLLGMRQGRFVNRTDWIGRGGTALEPLGPVVLLEKEGAPPATFIVRVDGRQQDLHSRLRGTVIARGEVWIQSQLLDAKGQVLAFVDERLQSQLAPFGSGYQRTWRVQALDRAIQIELGMSRSGAQEFESAAVAPWLSNQAQALVGNRCQRVGEDLLFSPPLAIALEPGQLREFNLCRLRLTAEALLEAQEAR
jgi:cytochrome c553